MRPPPPGCFICFCFDLEDALGEEGVPDKKRPDKDKKEAA